MSLSSVTTKTENLIHLGYSEGTIRNEYYVARADEEHGFVVAYMMGGVVMIQFFPWTDRALNGHQAYAAFITDRETQIMASNGKLFAKYPFVTVPTTDLLMIKCLIENATKELHDAKPNPDSPAGR